MADTTLPQRMRTAAETLSEVNALYDFQPDYGVWNPASLRKEAAAIEGGVPHGV